MIRTAYVRACGSMHQQQWLSLARGLHEALHWLQAVCAAPGSLKTYRFSVVK